MNDRAAFLAAILDAPDDDAPRLVYADWLDEQGGNGAFIREQIASGERISDWHIGAALSLTSDDVQAWRRFRFGTAHVRRGFIEAVELPWGSWRDHGDAILVAAPVQEVTLTTRPPLEWRGVHWSAKVGIVGFKASYPETGLELWQDGQPNAFDDRAYRSLLSARWPRVKTWNLPPRPVETDPRHDERITVELLDTETGERRMSERQFSAFWWAEGNGSCDCNRRSYFAGNEFDGVCAGATRYLVVRANTTAYSLDELNHAYPEELRRRHLDPAAAPILAAR